MKTNKHPLFSWCLTALLLIYPLTATTIHDAGNIILFLLLILALISLVVGWHPSEVNGKQILRAYWPMHLAMVSACIAILIHQVWTGDFGFKYYDRALRLATFPLILWVLLFIPLHRVKWLQWSFIAAAFIITIKAYVYTQGGDLRPSNIGFLSCIAYADIGLLLGVLAIISLGWNKPKSISLVIIKALACTMGAYASILTATRGSWLAVPLLAIFFFYFARLKVKRKALWAAGLIVVIVFAFSLNRNAYERMTATSNDLISYSDGENKTTSTGLRLQLWGAALNMIKQAPIFGIGREHYDSSIQTMVAAHEVTPELTAFAHSHNEILFNTVISGVFGLISTLALYIVPGYYFWRERSNPSDEIRTAAYMGCTVAICFFAFGLTDLMFFWPVLGGYYSIMIASLMRFIIQGNSEAQAGSHINNEA